MIGIKSTKAFLSKLDSKSIFLILGIIIFLHLILFILYAAHTKHSENKVNHDIMIQQVINLIERVNYTSPSERYRIVKAVDIPNVTIGFDDEPQWDLQLSQTTSLWRISEALRKQTDVIELSLQYGPDAWLNIYASTVRNSWWWFQLFLLSLEIVVVTAIIFSIWTINRFAIPLKNFKKAADRLGIDLDSPPLKVYGPAIVRDTANAMNQLQAKIRDLIKERTAMLAALSHDLRTPITRMKLRSQFIDDPELHQKTISDLDQMELMIAETLAFAKNNTRLEKPTKLDLNSLLSSICDDFKDIGYLVTFEDLNERIAITGRPVALKRAFNNLIENAVKYGQRADVKLTTQDNKAIIIFEDEGPGIPDDQLNKVFEPFYRGDNSRSRETGGTGLGLSVTQDIIRAHGGSIQLENKQPQGLRVVVTLGI